MTSFGSSHPALLTDRYELTMIEAALRDGHASRRCVFEVFARRLPSWRRYGVFAGTGRLMEQLADFRFTDTELSWLSRVGAVDGPTLEYLENYQFSGTIIGYGEGECYFPGSPVLTVEGTFAECTLLETLILSILNHDTAVASAASRMTLAAGGRPCLEMGARRTHEQAAVAAARAAYIAGFAGTSILEAGLLWDIPTIGTSAHSFTLLHDDEPGAFRSQLDVHGGATTLLLDTYDVPTAVRTAIELAGPDLAAVRIDSGDLTQVAAEVRSQLDALGAVHTKITVTSDLDEYAIASLAVAPVDSYGVGTRLVTGSGAPTAEMVYKLVAREDGSGVMRPVAKHATDKSTIPGFKTASRVLDSRGRAMEERVVAGIGLGGSAEHTVDVLEAATRGGLIAPQSPAGEPQPIPGSGEIAVDEDMRPLQISYVQHGAIDAANIGAAGLRAATARHHHAVAELPREAHRLSSGEVAIPTSVVRY